MTTFGSIGYRSQKFIKLRCRQCGELFETYPAAQQLWCVDCRRLHTRDKLQAFNDTMRQRSRNNSKRPGTGGK